MTVVKIEKRKEQKSVSSENCKSCLEATQLENKVNYLEKSKIDINRLKRIRKQIIRNNKSILKTQQRFKSKRHNVFTKEINKIVVCSNDDKRMQSINLIEKYVCGMNKNLASEQELIKCNNIMKRYKNDYL